MSDSTPVILKFNRSGGAYARAKEVATWMGIEIEAYLLKCIEEGHKLHQARMVDDLGHPAYLRRASEPHSGSTVHGRASLALLSPLNINPASTPRNRGN